MKKGKQSVDKIDTCSIESAFQLLTGGQQEMDEEAFSNFITNVLKLPEDCLLQFYIMTKGMNTPKMGHIKYANFQHLFKFAGRCKNIKALKKVLPKMEKDLTNQDVFKQMYSKTYQAFLIKNLSLDFELALYLWNVLLADKFKFHQEFVQFLDDPSTQKPQKCHKDLWEMMYEFAITVNSMEGYKQSDGWPAFLDQFMEFMKKKVPQK